MSDYDRRKFQIEASLDATGVREGAQEAVNAVKGMAAGIKEEGAKGAQGLKPIEDAPDRAAAAMSRSEKSMVASIERATAAMRTGGKAGADYYEVLAKQRGISGDMLKPYIDQLRQAEEAQRKLRQAEEARQQLSKATAGISDKQTAAALRGVPAQFTDIIVSLQGGQAPLTVLLQQGGQLKDMFGGAGQATKALGSYILGLVNPLTLAATAAGVLTYGFYSGAQEAQAFRVSLEKTGYQGGLTVNSLSDMSAAMGKLDGITRGQAVDALILMSAESQVGSDRLQRYTTTALQWEKATGEAAKTVAEGFKKIGEDPVKGVLELNKSMGFLTSATFEQIKSLQEAGRVTDAARLASDAYDKALADAARNIQANLGVVERGWNSVTGAIRKAIDEVKRFGRADSQGEVIDRLQTLISNKQAGLETYKDTAAGKIVQQEINQLQTKVEQLKSAAKLEGDKAVQKAESNRVELDGVKAVEAVTKANERALTKQEQKTKALKDYDSELAKIRKANPASELLDPKLIAKTRASIEEQFKEKGGGKPANTAPATRRLDLSEIQNEAREQVRVIEGQQKDLERLRQSGLIDDDSYYAQRRALIEQTSKVEEGALQEQITRLGQEKSTGVDALAVKKQIADTESKLAAKRLETGEKLKALNFEETQAIERQRIAMETLAQSHKRALEQMERQQQRTISTAWMGSKDRQRAESLWGIKDKYLAEQRRLEDQRMFTVGLSDNQGQQIEKRLADLQVEKDREIRIHQDTYTQLDMLQSKWEMGASFAMQNYADQAANVALLASDAFTNGLKGMEDALVTFVTTGKLSFSSLANSIVADITRIIIKQQISNAMGVGGAGGAGGGWLGSLIGMGANAFGGTSAVATMASAMPGDALSNFIGMMPGLATGGYAGEGGKHEPMGLYHGGEYVINAENTKRIGLGMLDRLNSGGKVPVEALRGVGAVEQAAPASKAQAAVFNINIPVQGGVDRRTKGQIASEAARALSRVERMR